MTADLIAKRLRHHAATLRTNSLPLSDLIPLLCQAADALDTQSPAEGDAGLTYEQAEAIAAFYDVSPGTVHDIYALSKPKAASDTQPKGTPAGMVLVEGAAFHDGSVSLMRHDAVESFCARRGAERLYRLTAAQSPAPAPEFDVRRIMLDVVPGDDGMGEEVYAKSVADVVAVLTRMGERIEDLESRAHGIGEAQPPVQQMGGER